MSVKVLPVTTLRPHLLKCISNAEQLGREYVITKKGKPSAVIIGFDEWESLKETREILTDKESLKRIKKSRDYFKKGNKGKLLEEVLKSDGHL